MTAGMASMRRNGPQRLPHMPLPSGRIALYRMAVTLATEREAFADRVFAKKLFCENAAGAIRFP